MEAKYAEYPALSKYIKDGRRLHGFRSGGGLRVVYLADPGRGPCSSNDEG